MNVVVEGPDNTGKSTLIQSIRAQIPELTFVPGGGPEKFPEEINHRIKALLPMKDSLFDRHPCVSQMIYGRFRDPVSMVEPSLLDQFYATKPIFVYCFGPVTLDGQEVKDYDTPEHLALLNRHNTDIHRIYRAWADLYADIQFCFSTVHWGSNPPPSYFHSTHQGVIDDIKERMR